MIVKVVPPMETCTKAAQPTSELLEKIEKTSYFQWMTHAGSMFKEVRDLATKRGEIETARHAQFEIEIHHLAQKHPFINRDYRQRFEGEIGYANGSEWPCLREFSQEQFAYYQSRLNETANPFLKCRYVDVLFECYPPRLKLNRFELGKILVDLLIETGSAHLLQPKPDFPDFLFSIARATDVAITLNNAHMLDLVLGSLIPIMEKLGGKDVRWLYEVSLIMRGIFSSPMGSRIPSEIYVAVTRRVDEARAYFLESEYLLTWHRSFCEELIAWGGLLKWGNDALQTYRMEIGESYEREAEKEGTKYGSNILKAMSLEDALRHYMNIGATQKIDELKVRIREAYAASRQEGHSMSWTLEIPTEEIEKRLLPYKGLSIPDSLLLMASDPSLMVDVDSIEKQASEHKNLSPFMYKISQFVLDEDRKVFQSDSDESSFKFMADHDYKIALTIRVEALLKEIFRILTEQRGMEKDDVVSFLRTWPLLDERNSAIVSI